MLVIPSALRTFPRPGKAYVCFVSPLLHAMQARIMPGLVSEQILVAALFHDLPPVHDDDAVGIAYCTETVGDDENGTALADRLHVLLNDAFRFVVERTGGFLGSPDSGTLA